MAFTNFDTKEINCKILLFGPSKSGKTSTVRSIYEQTSDEVKSQMMELSDQDQSHHSPLFDFLPIHLGEIKDFSVKLHVFSLSMSNIFETLKGTLIKGVDGLVFVVDSRIESMVSNIDCLKDIKKILKEHGYIYENIPKVIQYNKRDLEDIVPTKILSKELNQSGFPEFETIATQSIGTYDLIDHLSQQIVTELMA